jgi:signal transduction histidine kinase
VEETLPNRDLPAELEREARRYAGAGRLLTAVSHDLNNLLQPITGYLELLAARLPAAGEEAEMVAVMGRSTEIAVALVHRLLGLARSGEVPSLRLAPDRLIESLDPLVRAAAGTRVRLDVVLGAPAARVSLPAGGLEQIVLNLVANARDAMPGGGALTLRSGRAGGSWSLEVVDTGSGIDLAEPERLFESGYTTKQRSQGTGLGLWIVRSLVEEGGGEVEIGNAAGGGTRVAVRLPLAPADYQPSR